MVRIRGRVGFKRDMVLQPREIDALVAALLAPHHVESLRKQKSADLSLSVAGCRLRLNVFVTFRGLSLAVRFLPGQIPSLELLNLHPTLNEFCRMPSGLVLLCGSTGSGKTTTIAAMLNAINETRSAHVITLEDPIEFRFDSKISFFEQRELGTHLPSFERGLEDVLREAPDVIFVGELRDPQTMRLTLNAAASGHLVFATLHASDPEEALHRLFNSFPLESQSYIRNHVAACLKGLIVQQIIFNPRLGFSIPELCIMHVTGAVKNAIRDNRLGQLDNIIETGREKGMFSFGRYRQEFLDAKRNFNPPGEIFRATVQNGADEEYVSPLLGLRQQAFRELESEEAWSMGGAVIGATPMDQNVDDYIRQLTSTRANGQDV